MLKDIENLKVEDVALAIVDEREDGVGHSYYAYLLNMKGVPLENILIRSNGYGEHDGRSYETTELRRFYPELGAHSALKIEPVLEEAFKLTNQYWVSFYIGKTIYDKKYVFVPGSVSADNFITIPYVNEQGVLIK